MYLIPITVVSILNTLSMTISTVVLVIRDVFGGGGGGGDHAASGTSPPKDEGALKKMFKKASRCPQTFY